MKIILQVATVIGFFCFNAYMIRRCNMNAQVKPGPVKDPLGEILGIERKVPLHKRIMLWIRKPKLVTEADREIIDGWYAEARGKKMSIKHLTRFIKHLIQGYQHDYGTIVHALNAGAIAAIYAADRIDQGGITGFQANALMWEFIRVFGGYDGPMRLIHFEKMLYPHHEGLFKQSIPHQTWNWLQKKAKQLLELKDEKGMPKGTKEVREHWEEIVKGEVPWGFKVEKIEKK